jgi:hypothetical protein
MKPTIFFAMKAPNRVQTLPTADGPAQLLVNATRFVNRQMAPGRATSPAGEN